MEKKFTCKKCGGEKIVKAGINVTVSKGRRQRYKCQGCGSVFYKEGDVNGES